MKKRLLSMVLALCMALTLLPTAALAADDATVRVNGTALVAGHEYAATATLDGATALAEKTNETTNYFTYTVSGATATITVTGEMALASDSGTPLIYVTDGALTVNAPDGSITLANGSGVALQNQSESVSISAKGDLTVRSGGSDAAIYAGADLISATGKITVENTETGQAVYGALTARAAGDITVRAATQPVSMIDSAPAVNGTPAIVSESGSISLTNAGGGAAVNGVLSAKAKGDLTVTNSGSPNTINGIADLTSETGKITVRNTGSANTGMAVSGALTAHAAGDITVRAATAASLIGSPLPTDPPHDIVSDNGSISLTNAGRGAAVNGELSAKALNGSILVSGMTDNSVISSAVTLLSPQVTVIGKNREFSSLVNGALTVSPGAAVTLSGGGSSVVVKDTDDKGVTPTLCVTGKDVTTEGLNLPAVTPTAATLYTAGSGTILWEPTLKENAVTSGTLTLRGAKIEAASYAISLPNVPITMQVEGENTLTGSSGIFVTVQGLFYCDLIVDGAAGSRLNITAGGQYSYGITNTNSLALVGSVAVEITATGDNSYGVWAAEQVFIDSNATLSAKGGFIGLQAGSLTGTERFTGTAEVKNSNYTYEVTIYGVQELPGILTSGNNRVSSLTIPVGSALTVPKGKTLDLSWVTDFDTQIKIGGGIVNNGTVLLPVSATDAQIKALNITGAGTIAYGNLTEGAGTENEVTYAYGGDVTFGALAIGGHIQSNQYWKAGDGRVLWNKDTYTLTLDNATMTSYSAYNTITLERGITVTLVGSSTLTSYQTGKNDACLSASGDLTINGTGSLRTVYQIEEEDGIYVKGNLTVEGSASLTADQLTVGYRYDEQSSNLILNTDGAINVSFVSVEGSFTNTDSKAKLKNCFVSRSDGAEVYGNATVSLVSAKGNLSIPEGASLTIPEGGELATPSVSGGGTLVNNGMLMLGSGDGDTIKSAKIQGSGIVLVAGMQGGAFTVSGYTNQGAPLKTLVAPVEQDMQLILSDKEVTAEQNAGYTWTKDSKGVWTFRLMADVLYGELVLPQDVNAVIDTPHDAYLIVGVEVDGGSLTFTGSGRLYAGRVETMGGVSVAAQTVKVAAQTVTVAAQTVTVAAGARLLITNGIFLDAAARSSVTVNGTLTELNRGEGALSCGQLTIGSTGTLNLSGMAGAELTGNDGSLEKAFLLEKGGVFNADCWCFNLKVSNGTTTFGKDELSKIIVLPEGALPEGYTPWVTEAGNPLYNIATIVKDDGSTYDWLPSSFTAVGGKLTLHAAAPSVDNGGSGGSSGGSGGSGSSVSLSGGFTGSQSGSTLTVGTGSQTELKKTTDTAVAAGSPIVIDVAQVGGGAAQSITAVQLPSNLVQSVAKAAENGATGLTVGFKAGALTMDGAAVREMAARVGGNSLTLSLISGAKPIDSANGALLSQKALASYEISITAGNTPISKLTGKTKVTVAQPANLGQFTVYTLDETGEPESVNRYPHEGVVDFYPPHFSPFYLVSFPFADVAEDAWYREAVAMMQLRGVMEGTSATAFSPNAPMTRQMLWTVLGRLDGQALTGSDVFDAAKTWAMKKGVSDGTNPAAQITREQLVTMLWRQAGSPMLADYPGLSTFADAGEIAPYARQAMAWAHQKGIISGTGATTLSPTGTATRAQVAVMLSRYARTITK